MKNDRLIQFIALATLFWLTTFTAYADCTSFPNYNPNKRITLIRSMVNNWPSLGWLVGMRCDDVNKIRLDVIEEYQKKSV